MEPQLNVQVNLLERGTYKNLADLKQQIMLFGKQLFNGEEKYSEEEDLGEEEDLKDDDDDFAEETDDSIDLEDAEELENTDPDDWEDEAIDPTR
jgi:hypothetical protein